jgi:hypothetical protein
MKKSLQEIQDFYENRGFKGERLRKALLKDKEWLRVIRERRKKLTKEISISKTEKTKYVMSTDRDYEILSKIRQLRRLRLTKDERHLVNFITTQLEHDWRKHAIKTLDRILLKYRSTQA